MGFPRKLLNSEEELVLDLRPHWVYLAGSVTLLVAAIVADVVIGFVALGGDFDSWWRQAVVGLMLLALLAALARFLMRYAKWATTHFVVTSERLIASQGVISKDRKEIPLDRINDVSFHRGLLERLVGAGDLTIESAGEHSQETFSDIRHPDRVQQEIFTQTKGNQARQHQTMWQSALAAAPAPAAPNAGEQIEQLTDMFRRGLLSQPEYDQKKAELLRRM